MTQSRHLPEVIPSPRLTPVLAFTGGYTALLSGIAILTGAEGLGLYLGVLTIAGAALYLLHRRHPVGMPLLWAFSIWGLAHMTGGLVMLPAGAEQGTLVYNVWLAPGWLRYDHAVHAYGFGITTLLCWHILRSAARGNDGALLRPSPWILLLCIAGGLGFGAVNEMIEFVTTLFRPENHIGDFANTGWDLVANFAGSLAAAAWILHSERRTRRHG